ncbi:ABC transporter ATP-binding protein [Pseudofrankia asymbiotica]|uniref:Sulfonate ABC transporter ATP-binding protein n=1 Tax=Pseudofrankia asymbiotica TaxID=1834516 RepID=A0A1V2I8K4_9ACTN|nr:ABC transporter ATP-binding protein [Pseudofrankia asymbiotica]ONH27092.1 sulfonate ABC transporter ATP-binding protein [Pseudofrankia asymbiotica]
MATRLHRNLNTTTLTRTRDEAVDAARAPGTARTAETAGVVRAAGTAGAAGTARTAGTARVAAEGSGGAAVRVRGLRRAFGERVVLDGLDLTVAAGEFVALLGRSGSGKSTLLRVLGGFDTGIEGDVLAATRRSVVFQEARLLPWTRALGNVTLGLPGRDVAARGRAALAEVGLAGREQAWPVTLSGGEAQRVALARALVREPDLVLLDEPFGALDALTRIRMHSLLRELCRRHRPAVLFVTHDVDEAILLADRVLVLTDGRLSLDLPVDVASPRLRADPAFAALRSRLLAELGVDDLAEGTH